jgi:hypothetical protein
VPWTILEGLTPRDLVNLTSGESPIENSSNNLNLITPTHAVYPKKSQDDAPYSVDENSLRSAIYTPSTFTYGKNILPSYSFLGLELLLARTSRPIWGSCSLARITQIPVYVNIPGNQLADIQVGKLNALIVVTESNSMPRIQVCGDAISHISAISGNENVSMLSWPEGSLDGQRTGRRQDPLYQTSSPPAEISMAPLLRIWFVQASHSESALLLFFR